MPSGSPSMIKKAAAARKKRMGKGYGLLEREQMTTKIIQDALGDKKFNPGYKKGGMVKKAAAKKSSKKMKSR